MEKTKLLSVKDRPSDYLISTCPICGRTRQGRKLNTGAQLNKTDYYCDFRAAYVETNQIEKLIKLGQSIENICMGRYIWNINPKYI